MSPLISKLIENCLDALNQEKPQQRIKQLIQDIIETPETLYQAIGLPTQGGIEKLFVSERLTVINVVWAPHMTMLPHNHNMWAVIGVYQGREDNIFWRRPRSASFEKLEAAGAQSLGAGEAVSLGQDLVHSVTNPCASLTGALHVYGGDFFAMRRSEWDPLSLQEKPYDLASNLALFKKANSLL